MATMTMTFDVPETKVLDKAAFQQKVTDLISFFIASLPDKEMDETEYIMSNPHLTETIKEGDKQIASGKFETIQLQNLWK